MKPHHRNHRQFKDSSRRKSAEATANSVDEAIIKALTELRVPKERARIEVLDEGKPKLLGLFGGRPARVRATLKGGIDVEAPQRGDRGDRGGDRGGRRERGDRGGRETRAGGQDRPVGQDRPERAPRGDRPERGDRDRDRDRGDREARPARASSSPVRPEDIREKAAQMLRLMGAEPGITIEERSGEVWLKVESSELDGVLIGRRGETLTAMEHLLTRMSSLHDRDRVKVILDIGGYRSRKGAPAPGGMLPDDAMTPVDDSEDLDEVLEAETSEFETVADAGETGAEGGRKRRRRGRRGRGGRGEGREEAGVNGGEAAVAAPRGFTPRGLGTPVDEAEMEEPGGALLDEAGFDEPEDEFDAEPALEADEADEVASPVAAAPAAPAVRDPEDDFREEDFGGSRPHSRSGGSGGGGGRDRDRDRRGGRSGGGGRDRDRGRGGRDRDRDDRPHFETTPEIRASISESKRLEQELMARMGGEQPAAETGQPEAAGPKMPTFKKNTKKRRGYAPPGA
ncbi:MAG: Jag N-terminal domain-containing protein [Candidatus Eisenbacteria bacterium]|nr:Jag N-terminal domain-containing protein [Candidatus Eisenbacteria bacterium]